MGSDMVVALNQATVQGNTLFGLNQHDVRPRSQTLRRFVGGQRAPDEMLRLGDLTLPQPRRTSTVLGSQPLGAWGLTHGINEHRVAAGFSSWQSKLPPRESGLLGTDLVRLTLERSHSARQAFDVLTDLLSRHGQRGWGEPGRLDSIFLLADPKEAFVVEAAGSHWAMLECQQVRAVSDVALIRQDWRRLAPGLAELAISQGWWADDGSKLDVTGSLTAAACPWSLKRWSKATIALEQQHGHIDAFFLRSLLGDQFDSAAAFKSDEPLRLLTSFLAELPADAPSPPVAWCTYGPRAMPLFFPILLEGDLPTQLVLQTAAEESLFAKLDELLEADENQPVVDMLDRLQAQFDRQLDAFLAEARRMQDREQLQRQAGLLMHGHWEMLENETRRLPLLERASMAASLSAS